MKDLDRERNPISSKRLILRNSFFLVFSNIVAIVIGLYASRVLLEKLGIEDYGSYHVVGGIVVMFNSIQILFTNSIQRFLNYYKSEKQKQNEIFNAGIQVQQMMTVVFFVLTETIGIYAFLHLNLNDEKFVDAHIVYQLSVATAIVSMLSVPYDALILANERMKFYAWFSIIGKIFYLAIIYVVSIGPFSNIVNYAVLVFFVSILLRLIVVIYCKRHLCESRIHRIQNKSLIAKMTKFAGWNFLGQTGLYVSHQGVDYILNLTGGVAVNAARSLTYSIVNGVNALVGNASMAFKPQTNAAAAESRKKVFYSLLGYNAKTAFVCYLLLIVPILIFAKQLICLWLGGVPNYVIEFLLAISPYYLLRSLHELVNQFFISIGEMKWYQIIEICTMAFIVPSAWLMIRNNYPFWTVFICMTLFETVNHIGTVWLGVMKNAFPLRYFVKDVYLPFAIMAAIAFSLVYGAYMLGLNNSRCLSEMIIGGLSIELLVITSAVYIVLNKQERQFLVSYITSRLSNSGV